MSYRVAILFRMDTLDDEALTTTFTGVQDVKFSGDDGWPRVKLIYENGARFISTSDIVTLDMFEEEEE